MTTWREGRRLLDWAIATGQPPVRDFLKALEADPPHRAPGTAVYLTSEASAIPRPLTRQVQFQRTLHVVILTFVRAEVPRLDMEERIDLQTLAPGIYRLFARYGFMEQPTRWPPCVWLKSGGSPSSLPIRSISSAATHPSLRARKTCQCGASARSLSHGAQQRARVTVLRHSDASFNGVRDANGALKERAEV